MNVAFFGTSAFAVPALKSLTEQGYSVVAVYTTPDAPVGRKQVLTPSPVKIVAQEFQLPLIQPKSLKSDTALEQFASLRPDIAIVAAYGKILPQPFLDIPRFGFLNIHPSLLPKYRGPSPIQSAIADSQRETGITIMKMDTEVDHGPILKVKSEKLSSEKYCPEITQQLAELGADLLLEVLPDYLSGKIKPQEQDRSQATFTKKITSEDGHIDWSQPAETIYNKVRAYNPEPGTWTVWQDTTLKILRAHVVKADHAGVAGQVSTTHGVVLIATGKNYIAPDSVQLGGKKAVDITTFINGHPSFIGSVLP